MLVSPCVRSWRVFWNLWLQIALSWLHRFILVVAKRIVMAAWMLHGACAGKEAGARNLVFFRVKWLQPAMKGTSCARRVRSVRFCVWLVHWWCFAMLVSSRVRSSRVFWNLWLQIEFILVAAKRIVMAVWMLHGACAGEEAGAKPCVFPYKVASAGDERYLLCAAGAVRSFWCVIGSWFLDGVLQCLFRRVCVVVGRFGICGCRSHCHGCIDVY